MDRFERMIRSAAGLHAQLAQSNPKLARGQVWCNSCGATRKVDSAYCLRHGWPLCCGSTMSIDSPQERAKETRG